MADQWYYWHDAEVLGPFSGKQLFDLATAGSLIPTDTVWKDGVEAGVQASLVQNLFATITSAAPGTDAPIPVATQIEAGAVAAGAVVVNSEGKPVEAPAAVPTPQWDAVSNPKQSKGRAVAGKGAVIVGQDGKTVKFRMKCTTCSYEDSSWKTIPITRGTTRAVFFCKKCKKQRHAEINGFLS
jgi:hypothetical protein